MSQPDHLLGSQDDRHFSASPLMSQGLSQRSAAGLSSLGMQHHSLLMSQQLSQGINGTQVSSLPFLLSQVCCWSQLRATVS